MTTLAQRRLAGLRAVPVPGDELSCCLWNSLADTRSASVPELLATLRSPA